MLTVLQRVTHAAVTVDGHDIAKIGQGILLLCGFETGDNERILQKMLDKCFNYRVFDDQNGKMNLSVIDLDKEILLVPQFTLVADTKRGLRPSFSNGAPPETGRLLFERLVDKAKQQYAKTACGQFGADMKVTFCNDGPVTFILPF